MIFESDEDIDADKSDEGNLPASFARPLVMERTENHSNFENDVDCMDQFIDKKDNDVTSDVYEENDDDVSVEQSMKQFLELIHSSLV